ncbi:MAG TPA: HAD family hydrolase [Archaeoglobus veneficus]|nr:HAD family hydrolase [Archaeoglobus veneficus]
MEFIEFNMRFKTFVFDLDGTIVELNLPFDEIRREIGIKDRFILESIAKMDEEKRKRCFEILEKFEVKAAKKTKLVDGAEEIFKLIEKMDLKKGIVTRNCRKSVDVIIKKFNLDFDFVVTREDAEPKPSPEPIQLALKIAKTRAKESITVGDFKFDLIAGKLAGTKTALILHQKNRELAKDFLHLADFVFENFKELKKLIF